MQRPRAERPKQNASEGLQKVSLWLGVQAIRAEDEKALLMEPEAVSYRILETSFKIQVRVVDHQTRKWQWD